MKRPSFQFYPADWLSDPNVIAMSAVERGAYIHLIAVMWNTEGCSLNPDEDYLAKIAAVDKVVITSIYHCFKVVNNTLRHGRLDKEIMKQDEYRKLCSDAGKEGMRKRWGDRKKADSNKGGNKVVITEDNPPSPTVVSKRNIKEKKFVAPTLPEVEKYFLEKGYSAELAKTAFEYYSAANWKDGEGKQVLNWKQKMIGVWLKPKNKEVKNDPFAGIRKL